MSDQRLRELERRWTETGAAQDEAVYLSERVRAGALSQERLRLAAYCQHQASMEALGAETGLLRERREPSDWHLTRGDWGRGLQHADRSDGESSEAPSELGREATARALLASGWAVLPVWCAFAGSQYAGHDQPEALLRWLDEIVLGGEISGSEEELRWLIHDVGALSTGLLNAQTQDARRASDAASCCWGVAMSALDWLGQVEALSDLAAPDTGDVFQDAGAALGSALSICNACRDEVVPWLLGYSDPVRERVEAHQREAQE